MSVRRRGVSAGIAVALVMMVFAQTATAAAPAMYRVQLDARPPVGEPWSFLRFFPRTLQVHQGDTVNAAWAGVGTPHTATLVPSGNANAWRATNQGPGGPQDPSQFPWALQVPDGTVGGDDNQIDINPAVAAPSDPSCGSSGNPCTFDGTGVVSSGFQFSSPGTQPQFFTNVTAPVGSYSFVCLLHPGMQLSLEVVSGSTSIPSPTQVADRTKRQVRHARTVDAPIADDLAQTVKRTPVGDYTRLTIWAGGFWNQVSADEYPDRALRVHRGDRVRVLGNFEIHTATFPKSSAATVPFTMTQCEVTGPDTPATSPADCGAPTDFQVAFNSTALLPTAKDTLTSPSAFVNSGLVTWGTAHTFVAKQPGVYRFVCLVHGPQMSSTVRVLSG
jgi:plastocyanin